MLTAKEAFVFAFHYRCAEEGLTADQARDRARRALEKQADGLFSQFNPLGTAWEGAKAVGGLGKNLAGLAALGLVATPIAAGGAAGLLAARTQEKDIDPAEVRRNELIAALNFHADRANRRAGRLAPPR